MGCLIYCQIEGMGECQEGVPRTWSTASQRRRNYRLCLLMKILQDEERHLTLSVAYDEKK